MTVREIVLERDVRSPFRVPLRAVLSRYHVRRLVSVALLVGLDLAAVALAANVAPVLLAAAGGDGRRPSAAAVLAAAAVAVGAAAASGLYGRRLTRRRPRRLLAAALVSLAGLVALCLVAGAAALLPTAVAGWALACAAALALRSGYDLAIAAGLRADLDSERVLLLGPPDDGPPVLAALGAADPATAHGLVATVAPADAARLADVAEATWPSLVVVTDLDAVRTHMPAVVALCRRRHIPLFVAAASPSGAQAATGVTAPPEESSVFLPGLGEPLFAVRLGRSPGWRYLVKRAADVAAAAVLLVLLSPLLLAIALLVRLTSPGPALYVSRRVGLGQRPFPCFKFRTMCADAEARQAELEARNEASGCIFKIADDPRVTRVGRFLRRTSLDELPQLLNVLRGEMSLVGPRPLPLRDVDLMEDRQKRRHLVLPGITGLWQVSGRSQLGGDEMLALDLEYIDTWSLRGDLRILARTVGAVLGSRGAC